MTRTFGLELLESVLKGYPNIFLKVMTMFLIFVLILHFCSLLSLLSIFFLLLHCFRFDHGILLSLPQHPSFLLSLHWLNCYHLILSLPLLVVVSHSHQFPLIFPSFHNFWALLCLPLFFNILLYSTHPSLLICSCTPSSIVIIIPGFNFNDCLGL